MVMKEWRYGGQKKTESPHLKVKSNSIEESSSASAIATTTVNDEKQGLEVIKPSSAAKLNEGDILIFDHFAKRKRYQFKLTGSSMNNLQKNIPNATTQPTNNPIDDDDEIEIVTKKKGAIPMLKGNDDDDDNKVQIVSHSNTRKCTAKFPVKKRARQTQQQAADYSDDSDVIEVIDSCKKKSPAEKKKVKPPEIVDLTPVESLQIQAASLQSSSHLPAAIDNLGDQIEAASSAKISTEFDLIQVCGIVSEDSGSIVSSGIKSPTDAFIEGSDETGPERVSIQDKKRSMTDFERGDQKDCMQNLSSTFAKRSDDSIKRATEKSPRKSVLSIVTMKEGSSTSVNGTNEVNERLACMSKVGDLVGEHEKTRKKDAKTTLQLGAKRVRRLVNKDSEKSEKSVGLLKVKATNKEAVLLSDERRVGSRVYAEFNSGDDGWYWGEILSVRQGDNFDVLFDDGDVKDELTSNKVLSEHKYFKTLQETPPPCIRSSRLRPNTSKQSRIDNTLEHPGKVLIPIFSSDFSQLIRAQTASSQAEPDVINQSIVNSFYRSLVSSEPDIGYQLMMNCLVCCVQIPPEDILNKIFHTAVFGPKCDGVKLIDVNKHRRIIDYSTKIICHMNSCWDWEYFVDAVNTPLDTDMVALWKQSVITFEFITELFNKNEQVLESCDDVRFVLKETVRAVRSFYADHENAFDPSMTDDCERLETINTTTRLCKAYCTLATKLAHFIQNAEGLCEQDMLYLCLTGVDFDCDLFVIFEDMLLCH